MREVSTDGSACCQLRSGVQGAHDGAQTLQRPGGVIEVEMRESRAFNVHVPVCAAALRQEDAQCVAVRPTRAGIARHVHAAKAHHPPSFCRCCGQGPGIEIAHSRSSPGQGTLAGRREGAEVYDWSGVPAGWAKDVSSEESDAAWRARAGNASVTNTSRQRADRPKWPSSSGIEASISDQLWSRNRVLRARQLREAGRRRRRCEPRCGRISTP